MSSHANMLHVLRMPVPDPPPANDTLTLLQYLTQVCAVLLAGVLVLVGFHHACAKIV